MSLISSIDIVICFYQAIWLIHIPKWTLHCIALWLKQKQRPRRLNNYQYNCLDYDLCGLVPTPSECALERPKSLITDRV